MKLHNVLFWILVFYFQLSCQRFNNHKADFYEESFKENYYLDNGILYKNDSLKIENPTSIRFHVDSFLIIQEINSKKLIKIIDLKNSRTQEIIPQGKGPGEMLVPWGIEFVDDKLFVFCGQLVKVIVLKPDISRSFKIVNEFRLEETRTTQFFPLSENIFVCLSNIGDINRLTILDGNGKIIKKMGDYPPFLNSNLTKGDNNIFQSFISGSEAEGKIVVACKTTDFIEIYDRNNGMEKRIQGPLGIQYTIITQNVGKSYIRHPEPTTFTYQNIISSDKEFWVGYIGYKPIKGIKPNISDLYPKIIFAFDWKGNLLRKINFNDPIISFDVDWTSMTLYTIEWEKENPEIMTYRLNEYLK